MRSSQREFGKRAVIKRGRLPRGSAVAGLTGLRKSSLGMRRIIRFLKVRKMAADAGGRCPCEFSSYMACIAVQGNVGPGQRKTRKFQMVKLGAKPTVSAVALFARSGEARR